MRRLAATAVALISLSDPGFAENRINNQFGFSWVSSGNWSTGPSQFLGTLNQQPLVLKSGGQEALRILPNGNIGIGTTTPGAPLEVDNSAGDSDAASFVLSNPNLTSANPHSAVNAIHSGGSTTTFDHYGPAGNFGITNPMNTDPALRAGTVTPGGFALYGTESTSGVGVAGDDETPTDIHGKGVLGFSRSAVGVYGLSKQASGAFPLFGAPPAGAGVWGDSASGLGVVGTSVSGESGVFIGGVDGSGFCGYRGGAGWVCSSDRSLKTDFAPVDTAALLDRLAQMPVFTYRFKQSRNKALFLGPTAQDFAAAFHLGTSDDTVINTANAQGVALAAAKGLYERVKQDEAQIAALKAQVARLEQIVARFAAARPQQQASLGKR